MTSFQRARSEPAREVRRQAILDAAAQMLAEMPANDVTLNELSRRTRLAKSGLLKYFESREAVLLELLDRAWKQWIAELRDQLAVAPDLTGSARHRGIRVAGIVTRTVAEHPRFCDLLSAQASVLERNVSATVAGDTKKASFASVLALAALIRAQLPELGGSTEGVSAQIIMAVGAVWTHSQPSAGMLAAYEADPELAKIRLSFALTLESMVSTLVVGALALADGDGSPA